MTAETAPAAVFDHGERALQLQRDLGYMFTDARLLEEALTHPSCGCGTNYERLEFLGDAVLELAISDILYKDFPEAHEGALTRQRASLVQTSSLAQVAEKLRLGSYVHLGRGETVTSGRHKPTILENALEAVLGAIYLDGGIAAAQAVVSKLFAGQIRAVPQNLFGTKDPKTALQERIQSGPRLPVRYVTDGSEGPPHDPTFHVALYIGDLRAAEGSGSSKKRAEQQAAESALRDLESILRRLGG